MLQRILAYTFVFLTVLSGNTPITNEADAGWPLFAFDNGHLIEDRLVLGIRRGEWQQVRSDLVASVENLAHKLSTEITEMGFRLAKIEVRETDTSVLTHTREDWIADNRRLTGSQGVVSHRESAAESMSLTNAADSFQKRTNSLA